MLNFFFDHLHVMKTSREGAVGGSDLDLYDSGRLWLNFQFNQPVQSGTKDDQQLPGDAPPPAGKDGGVSSS